MTNRRKIKMANNQSVFRHKNERIQRDMEQLRQLCEEEHEPYEGIPLTSQLLFVCECSDDLCTERIRVSLGRYIQLHLNRSRFIICLHHELPTIEKVVKKQRMFEVVEKFRKPIEDAKLMTTF